MPFSIVLACLFSLAAGIASYFLTVEIARRAQSMGLVQTPNARSSHKVPTPSGGGVAFALTTMLVGGVFSLWEPSIVGVVALSAAMGALGFVDDLRDLRASLRFPIQIVLVFALVWWCAPYPAIELSLGWSIGGTLLVVALSIAGLWWLNLFNFMDGIDGLAASQGGLILAGCLGLWLWRDPGATDLPVFWLAVATIAAVIGFLLNNWPPARIFMGDAGSNFLAMIIFAVLLILIGLGVLGYGTALILTSVLSSDATVTLIRRGLNGEKPWAAHRRHAYQQLSRRFGHRFVTLAFAGIHVIWALPLAAVSLVHPNWQLGLTVLAFLPLVLLALHFGAGARTETAIVS